MNPAPVISNQPAPTSTDELLAASDFIGRRYRLIEPIGAGGMGTVYWAYDRLTGQSVALKRVRLEKGKKAGESDTDLWRTSLTREFQTLASLRHPRIIDVIDYGFDRNRQPYFTMTLLQDAQTILQHGRGISASHKVRLLVQICQALLYLHRRGILHRDLKPGNIMVVNGEAKVLDFGVATERTGANELAGTVYYMAPEILQGGNASEASDLYALGLVAYELFTGIHPYRGEGSLYQILHRINTTDPDFTLFTEIDRQFIRHAAALQGETEQRTPSTSAAKPENSGVRSTQETVIFNTENLTSDPAVSEAQTVLFSSVEADAADTFVFSTAADDNEFWPEGETQRVSLPHFPQTGDSLPVNSSTSNTGSTNSTRGSTAARFAAQYEREITADGADLPAGKPTLTAIVRRLLHRDPERRYQDAAEVIRDLSAALGEPLPSETAATRESFLQAARFVGRQRELALLESALTEAMFGGGGVWMLGGESGIGKSRLLNEVRVRALVRGAMVVRGVAAATDPAYGVWREPLRRVLLMLEINDTDASTLKTILPDISDLLGRPVADPEGLDSDEAGQRLVRTLNNLFQRLQQPTLIILEGLHWARADSLDLLKSLLAHAPTLPLLIIGSYRDDEQSAALRAFLSHVDEGSRLRLSRLDDALIDQLGESIIGKAAARPEVAAMLRRETEGNVYFLVEVIRALAEEAGSLDQIGHRTLPARVFTGGVQHLVGRRLARVPAWAQPLLRLAAVLGRQIDSALLRAAAPTANINRWLLVCSDAAVLEVQDERWRFTHDKLREGVLAGLSLRQAATSHRRAAEAIEKVYGDQPSYAAALADHWRVAGDVAKERAALVRAGDHAYRTGDAQGAVTWFERYLALPADVQPDTVAQRQTLDVQIKMAREYVRMGKHAEADALFEQLREQAHVLNEPALVAEIEFNLGRSAMIPGDYDRALTYLQPTLTAYQTLNHAVGQAQTLMSLGLINLYRGQVIEARTQLEQSTTLYREADDVCGIATSLGALSEISMRQGNIGDAVVQLEESLALSERIGMCRNTAATLMQLGIVAQMQGRPTESVQRLGESVSYFRDMGELGGWSTALNNLGYVHVLNRDFAAAQTALEDALRISRRLHNPYVLANTLVNLAQVELEQGASGNALEHLHEALSAAHAMNAVPLVVEIVGVYARWFAQQGEHARARELANIVFHHPAANPDVKSSAEAALQIVGGASQEVTAEVAVDDAGKSLEEQVNTLLEQQVRSPVWS